MGEESLITISIIKTVKSLDKAAQTVEDRPWDNL